eukprot:CAMPEP_0179000828 /NCGR_PEP_ID=MMETSP0795-20121207/10938_1 /TAXON_ID=88552 /ORGANISM="Amoebophrya sp., Strain Ameob2" /LENGTH=61 /DNA_ID=CAMNT_0020693967 /DNA_START=52 /DNA_END=234 /DNA_ORIENTATION=+
MSSGRSTPMLMIPTPDFAVPYAAPRLAKTMADVTPMKPKKLLVGSQGTTVILPFLWGRNFN